MTEPTGLRARKKLRTRNTIEDAAMSLFARNGFAATTIDQIAAAADIAPRTFFHYFPSKEDVVLADYRDRLDRIIEIIVGRPTDEAPWQALRVAFRQVGSDYENQRDRLLPRFRIIATTPSVAARSLQLQTSWEDAVAVTVAGRLDVDPDIDLRPRLIAGAALAAMRAALRRWLGDPDSLHLPDCISDCFDVLEMGLGTITRTN